MTQASSEGKAVDGALQARMFSDFVQSILRQLQAVLAAWHMPDPLTGKAALAASPDSLPPVARAPGAVSHWDVYRAWAGVCEASRRGFAPLFDALGVQNTERGESTYAHAVEALVDELLACGAAEVTQGAVGIFVDGREKPPMLIRKADGGFLYATTDMVALRSRLRAGYDRIVYVTDAAQGLHFRQLFAAARAVGWLSPGGGNMLHPTAPGTPVLLEHAAFGVVTGATGRKLSSRDGSDATLASLLAEARAAVQATAQERETERAREREKRAAGSEQSPAGDQGSAAASPQLTPDATAAIAHSAVRYFDLSHAAASNYRLSFESALSLRGNTAPYLMYALTRLTALRRQAAKTLALSGATSEDASGGRDGGSDGGQGAPDPPSWDALIAAAQAASPGTAGAQTFVSPAERALSLSVLRLPEALGGSLGALSPHVLAEHMFTLASDFHSFYEACRVCALPQPGAGPREAAEAASRTLLRLHLCSATDRALRLGCGVLGVRAIARM